MCLLLVRLVFCVCAKTLFIYPRGVVFEPLIHADRWFGMDMYVEAVFSR